MKTIKLFLAPMLITFLSLSFINPASAETMECMKSKTAKLDYDKSRQDYSVAINNANASRGTVGSTKAQAMMNKAKDTSALYYKIWQQSIKDCQTSMQPKKK